MGPISGMSNRATGTALGALVSAFLIAVGCAPGERQNVVLITLDTTRADFLSCYGYPEKTTPHLDELARQGTRFDLAVSTAAVTPVSHASILTGLDNHRHGLRVLSAASGYRLPAKVPTLATVLHGQGYSTIAVHSAFPVSAHFGLARGFDRFESFDAPIRVAEKDREKHSWSVGKFQRRSDETTDLALTHLRSTAEPFFLWVHYWDPHDSARIPPPEFLPEELRETGGAGARKLRGPAYRRLYAAEVRYMDAQIGRLLEAVGRKAGHDRSTIVAVVADHGEGLGDHGWAKHRILYQEQIRVPLMLRVPGHDQVPVVPELVRVTDILPTILDYLDIDPGFEPDGHSLRGLIEGERQPGRIAFADQINGFDFNADIVDKRPLDDFLYCAMDNEWKLIYRPTNPRHSELYRLTDDPEEARNLFRERPAEAVRLLQELAQAEPWVTAPFTESADGDDLAAIQEALGALGYLGGTGRSSQGLDWAWACPDELDRPRRDRRQGDCATPLIPLIPGPNAHR